MKYTISLTQGGSTTRKVIEAGAIQAGPDWIVFYKRGTAQKDEVVAAFPTSQVLSVIEEGASGD